MLKKNSVLFDMIVTFGVQFIILILNFLINKIFAINLGVESFGIFNIARRGATLIGFLILCGQGISIVRYLSIKKNKNNQEKISYIFAGLTIILYMVLLFILLLFFFNNILTNILFGSQEYKYLMIPILFFAFSTSISTYVSSVFRGLEKFVQFNISQLIIQVLIVVFFMITKETNLISIFFYWSMISLVVSIIFSIILFFKMFKSNRFEIINFKSIRLNMFKYGASRVIGEFIQFAYYLVPLVFVNNKFGNIEAGYFSASTGILQMMLPFFSYIGLVLLPKASSSITDGQFKDFKYKINKGMFVYLIISLLGVVFAMIFTPFIIRILYSTDFLSGVQVARVLIISLIPRSLFLLLRNPIDAISQTPYNTISLLLSFLIMIVLMYFSTSVTQIALSFVLSDIILALCSLIIWLKSEKLIKEE
ncbi:hypothetical protein BW731_09130 [Vagococcus martis]|uniref:Polysaccharide biosynthesis protein C-terminal domain-containing protein n=1 Tax=Vagococcus martis TaxID=1768210 RepID=A0A1V4DIV5_9ENTE|nr:oligosaccharide flippase family protein [Vagococcus martis]OPF88322.1 hypothetical protein BW731_09130 [Vagococcus martis]